MIYKAILGVVLITGLTGCVARAVVVDPVDPVVYASPSTVYVGPAYTRSYYAYPSYRSYGPYYRSHRIYHRRYGY